MKGLRVAVSRSEVRERARPRSLRVGPALLSIVLAVGCGGGGGHDASTPEVGTPIGTLAYVVTECRENSSGFYGRQRLDVRRGDAAPVTIVGSPWVGPLPVSGLCQIWARSRYGTGSVYAGAFQRIGVTPDGSGVVFEVTDEFSIAGPNQFVTPDQEGIFFVRADGTGLRRLGPASRANSSSLGLAPTPTGFTGLDYAFFSFSPNGESFTFTDLGPAADGSPAIQIFVQDLDGGEARQITRLPPSVADADGSNPDGRSLIWSVAVDGSDLRRVEVVGVEGEVAPLFAVTGGGRVSAPIRVGNADYEVFSFDGTNLLQLTSFGRPDTGMTSFTSPDASRVFFDASADPFGTNPSRNCQLFSIDPLGDDLRQLTFFSEGEEEGRCSYQGFPGCGVSGVNRYRPSQDARTGTLVIYTSCDPSGGVSTGGEYYALRPDGSGIRALTDTYGTRRDADGTLSVEMPGPAAYGPYQ
jgi:hypothetical protein